MIKKWLPIVLAIGFSLISLNAFAYIGPGVGIGTMAVVLGIFFGFILILVGLIWYPLKRLFKTIRNRLRKYD